MSWIYVFFFNRNISNISKIPHSYLFIKKETQSCSQWELKSLSSLLVKDSFAHHLVKVNKISFPVNYWSWGYWLTISHQNSGLCVKIRSNIRWHITVRVADKMLCDIYSSASCFEFKSFRNQHSCACAYFSIWHGLDGDVFNSVLYKQIPIIPIFQVRTFFRGYLKEQVIGWIV